ncbi:MAG: hypothetical protein GY804_15530 [Alphaproteobacteria bacterium]|nr:hypothetical protein [Alphaproteobacteria bacterium]
MAITDYLDNNNELVKAETPAGSHNAILAATATSVSDFLSNNNIHVQVDTPAGPHMAVLVEGLGNSADGFEIYTTVSSLDDITDPQKEDLKELWNTDKIALVQVKQISGNSFYRYERHLLLWSFKDFTSLTKGDDGKPGDTLTVSQKETLDHWQFVNGMLVAQVPAMIPEVIMKGDTLYLGFQAEIKDVGSALGYTLRSNPDLSRIAVFTEFNRDGVVTKAPRTFSMTPKSKLDIVGEFDVEHTEARKFVNALPVLAPTMGLGTAYIYFGATVPAEIEVSIYRTSETDSNKIFQRIIDTSEAEPNKEFLIKDLPILLMYEGLSLFVIESHDLFTLKGNADNFYIAIEGSILKFRPLAGTVGIDKGDSEKYLQDKIVAGSNINLNVVETEAGKQLEISSTGTPTNDTALVPKHIADFRSAEGAEKEVIDMPIEMIEGRSYLLNATTYGVGSEYDNPDLFPWSVNSLMYSLDFTARKITYSIPRQGVAPCIIDIFQWAATIAPKGDTGNGIEKIELTETVGLVKTYTITYTDQTTFSYDVTDGADGAGSDGKVLFTETDTKADFIGLKLKAGDNISLLLHSDSHGSGCTISAKQWSRVLNYANKENITLQNFPDISIESPEPMREEDWTSTGDVTWNIYGSTYEVNLTKGSKIAFNQILPVEMGDITIFVTIRGNSGIAPGELLFNGEPCLYNEPFKAVVNNASGINIEYSLTAGSENLSFDTLQMDFLRGTYNTRLFSEIDGRISEKVIPDISKLEGGSQLNFDIKELEMRMNNALNFDSIISSDETVRILKFPDRNEVDLSVSSIPQDLPYFALNSLIDSLISGEPVGQVLKFNCDVHNEEASVNFKIIMRYCIASQMTPIKTYEVDARVVGHGEVEAFLPSPLTEEFIRLEFQAMWQDHAGRVYRQTNYISENIVDNVLTKWVRDETAGTEKDGELIDTIYIENVQELPPGTIVEVELLDYHWAATVEPRTITLETGIGMHAYSITIQFDLTQKSPYTYRNIKCVISGVEQFNNQIKMKNPYVWHPIIQSIVPETTMEPEGNGRRHLSVTFINPKGTTATLTYKTAEPTVLTTGKWDFLGTHTEPYTIRTYIDFRDKNIKEITDLKLHVEGYDYFKSYNVDVPLCTNPLWVEP